MRAVARARSPEDAARLSAALCAQLGAFAAANRPRSLLLYWPLAGEPDLGDFARVCLAAGRTVCVPRVRWAQGVMLPVALDAWDAGLLRAGQHGVMEPPPDAARHVEPTSLDMVVFPGLAFDPAGNRLGRGGGFYDRFARSLVAGGAKVGAAFDEQVVGRVPVDPWDTPVDAVVTPTRVLWARRTSPSGWIP